MNQKKIKIGIIGLGYVGLPLFYEFSKHFETYGFDVKKSRISNLLKGIDKNLEFKKSTILKKKYLKNINYKFSILNECNIFIITVPTPIDINNKPKLNYLRDASKNVAKILKRGHYVIFESTVFPGATEEICIPIIEKFSGLKLNKDFYCGYSPERINPGDAKHSLSNTIKITSGSSKKASLFIDNLYKKIIKAGTYLAKNIKTAEAAKITENIQRDVNIALVNELSIYFNKKNISSLDVINAAGSKWNFHKYFPGLVGGHCISVDPYYLSYSAKKLNINSELIDTSRKINNNYFRFIVSNIKKISVEKKIPLKKSKVLILGFSFKENCPDIRNTQVVKIYNSLVNVVKRIDISDNLVDAKDVEAQYGIKLLKKINNNFYDILILAVPHSYIIKMGEFKLTKLLKKNNIFIDLKSSFKKMDVDFNL